MDLRRITLKEVAEKMFLPKCRIIKWIRKYHIGVKTPGGEYRFNQNDFYKLKQIERGEIL